MNIISFIVFEICFGVVSFVIVTNLTSIQEKIEKIEKELEEIEKELRGK